MSGWRLKTGSPDSRGHRGVNADSVHQLCQVVEFSTIVCDDDVCWSWSMASYCDPLHVYNIIVATAFVNYGMLRSIFVYLPNSSPNMAVKSMFLLFYRIPEITGVCEICYYLSLSIKVY